MVWVYLAGGLALLALGGEFLVRGAVQLAERLGVSPLVIGLTLVGFGTSTPELVASVQASLAGSPGIAVGNVVGSNIANVLLILGVSALIAPIAVASRTLARDGGVVLATAAMFAAMGFVMDLGRVAGAVFVGLLALYLVYAWRQESVGTGGHTAAFDKAEALAGIRPPLREAAAKRLFVSLGMALGGLLLVVLGGKLLVDGAIGLARALNIAESVIGLTVVAVGTSMPELVTSVVAALRKQSDVALGNVLGSNIYNTLGIAGTVGLIAPTSIPPEMVRFDSLVMVGVSALALAFAWTGLRIGRREGGVLLGGYVAYIWWIWPV